MEEYTIHVESPRLGAASRELELAQAYLDSTDPDSGAACIVDYEKGGVLSATMQVRSHTAGSATDQAIELFYGALEAAGYNNERAGLAPQP